MEVPDYNRVVAEDPDEGVASGQKVVELSGTADWVSGVYAMRLGRSGRRSDAEAILHRLLRDTATRYVHPLGVMYAAAACGDIPAALDAAERMVEEHSPAVFWLIDEPGFDPFRREPRFSALLRRIGVAERY